MEAGVVVNFLNFFTDTEEENITEVIEELQNAGLEIPQIDLMFEAFHIEIKAKDDNEFLDD